MAQRRGHGEGTIYEDKARGRWVGAITLDGSRRKVVGKTKTEARERLNVLRKQADAGTTPGHGNVTLADALDRWEQRVLPGRDLAPATREAYRWCIATWRAELGTTRLRTLTADHVERTLDKLASDKRKDGRPLGRAALVKMRSVLGQVLDFAVRRNMVPRNVARVAELTPTAGRTAERTALTPDEARRLFDVLDGERLGPMFALAMAVGLRPGEAAGLTWDSVDLDAGRIVVDHAVRLEGRHVVVTDTLKTERSRRTLGVPPVVVAMLRRHRATQAAERLAARRWDDDRLVFATSHGTPYNPANVRRELTRICAAAEVPAIKPNELRHTAASIMSDAGVPLEQIADALGHTSTRMLEQHYRHNLRPSFDAAVPIMSNVLGGAV